MPQLCHNPSLCGTQRASSCLLHHPLHLRAKGGGRGLQGRLWGVVVVVKVELVLVVVLVVVVVMGEHTHRQELRVWQMHHTQHTTGVRSLVWVWVMMRTMKKLWRVGLGC